MAQARYIANLLEERNADVEVQLVAMSTSGDRLQDQPLSASGGKGLFLKELELALLGGEIDLAVHSMKDVPVALESHFQVMSVGVRAAVYDVLVGDVDLMHLNADQIVGTASARRTALLRHVFKHDNVAVLRGNVGTRLRKLDAGEVDALVLAEAGLSRLGLNDRVTQRLPSELFVPAVGQGTLAVEYLTSRNDLEPLIQSVQDAPTQLGTIAERRVAEILGADCAVPFGAHCEVVQDEYQLRSVVLSTDGAKAIRAVSRGTDAWQVAEVVAERLQTQGAAAILAEG